VIYRSMKHLRLYEEFSHQEINPAIQAVYALHPELIKIGTIEDYERYTREIFPNSKISFPVYHSSKHAFREFDPERIASSTDKGAFGRGFYFSQFAAYSKMYGEHTKICLVNLEHPKIILNLEGYNKEYQAYAGLPVKEIFGEEYDGVAVWIDDWNSMTTTGEHVSSIEDLYELGLGRETGLLDAVVPTVAQIHELGTEEDLQGFARWIRNI